MTEFFIGRRKWCKIYPCNINEPRRFCQKPFQFFCFISKFWFVALLITLKMFRKQFLYDYSEWLLTHKKGQTNLKSDKWEKEQTHEWFSFQLLFLKWSHFDNFVWLEICFMGIKETGNICICVANSIKNWVLK